MRTRRTRPEHATVDESDHWRTAGVAAGTLFAVHQSEEVVFSIEDWLDTINGTGSPRFDRYVRRSPIAAHALSTRALALVAQSTTLAVLALATRRSPRATRLLTSGICAGFGAAFVMHIVVAARTRSAMPGLATSVAPGLPGVVVALRRIWVNGSAVKAAPRR